MISKTDFFDDDEIQDLRRENARERAHHRVLSAHPDCRDPDHPGCEFCEDHDDQ
jgi:hypothetical protein